MCVYTYMCDMHACFCMCIGVHACVGPRLVRKRQNLHALSPGKTEQAFLSPWTARRWKTDL